MGKGQQGSKRELLAETNESNITSGLSIFAGSASSLSFLYVFPAFILFLPFLTPRISP